MVEAGTVMHDLTLENPIRAIRDVSHDMTGRRKVRLASGREVSALDIQRELQHLLGPRGERDMPGRGLLSLADDLLHLLAHRLQADPSDSSALAATPSPSWIRPSRTCSVPM